MVSLYKARQATARETLQHFHAESESAVRIEQFLHPEKIKKNLPNRVSLSYRKISYHISPP
jgi:hypothetical protein